ncbi:hypothetical protein GCM10023210_31240 [Chryseobacterium ginsengisoli]|uniref:Peptidase n=1 Tax=Chryseobacterium ginsengisoli TaxID=363853 RepID=A0ABP9MHV9_9FLAO
MKEYPFIASTENVNSYGYRILTEGIDISQYEKNPVLLYMHNRGGSNPTGDEVIGKARLEKKNNILYAYVTFDSKNEFASKIEEKVAGGFINMCSIWADPIETSTDPQLALPGQKYETVIKCKMIELSIVDIGGQDDALRLSAGNSPHKLQLINQQNTMSNFTTIALALGKEPNSTESTVLMAVSELKLSLETEKGKTKEWQDKYIALKKTEATALAEKAIKLGLFPEDFKDGLVSLFDNDYDNQHKKLSALIEKKESEENKETKTHTIEGVIKLSNDKTKIAIGDEESFDYLQKHDPAKLSLIRTNEPDKYKKLCTDFGAGVRYTGK